MKFLIFILFFGCASSTKVMLPSGENGFSIHCDDDKTYCYEKAQEVCPKGYDIADQDKGSSASMINNTMSMSANFTMLISCKK